MAEEAQALQAQRRQQLWILTPDDGDDSGRNRGLEQACRLREHLDNHLWDLWPTPTRSAPSANATSVAQSSDLPAESARLPAAVDAQRQGRSAVLDQLQDGRQTAVERARAAPRENAFAATWTEGETLSADAMFELGLDVVAQLQELLRAGADIGTVALGA